MFCRKCGKQIPDDSNVCMHCGCPVENVPQDAQVGVSKKKNNNKLIVIIVAVVLAVAVAIVGIVTGVMIGQKGNENPSAGKENTEVVNPTDGEKTEEGTEASTAEQTEKPKPAYLEATQKDFVFMNELFGEMVYFADTYDCTASDANAIAVGATTDLFSAVYRMCAEKYGFDEPQEKWNADGTMDPDKIYSDEYAGHLKFKASSVDWIARNIFNVEPTLEMYTEVQTYNGYNEEYCYWYRKGDSYYSQLYIGGRESSYKAEILSKERSDDGKYKVKFKVDEKSFDEKWPVGTFEVTAGLKEVDGKRVWCFEKWYKI